MLEVLPGLGSAVELTRPTGWQLQLAFMPHGMCYLWEPRLVWLHAVSESLIALAYYSIPALLVEFVSKRRDVPFPWIFWLFGAFIIACGSTHLMEVWTLWHPDCWVSGFLKAFSAGVSLWAAFELVPLLPSGEVGAQQWIDRAIFDERGCLVEIQAVGRDITGRMRAEAALRESEERFRSAFECAAIGFALVGKDGRFRQVNRAACKIPGYSESELLATNVQAITHPDDLETDLNCVRQLLAGEIPSDQIEKRYSHKLGHVVWVLLSVSLVRDMGGNPLYFIAQIQDITAQKQAEAALKASAAQLEASNREQQDFADVASHDLQEPLRKIQTFGDLAQRTRRERRAASGMQTPIGDLNRAGAGHPPSAALRSG